MTIDSFSSRKTQIVPAESVECMSEESAVFLSRTVSVLLLSIGLSAIFLMGFLLHHTDDHTFSIPFTVVLSVILGILITLLFDQLIRFHVRQEEL